MKRINPKTGVFFKYGDVRKDGYLFLQYRRKEVKKDGFFEETWLSLDKWEQLRLKNLQRAKNKLERRRQVEKTWRQNNPGKNAAKLAKRRSLKLQRTPSWLTKEHHIQIDGFYLLAKEMEKQLGGKYEVDHIVALQGKEVSGLHVPWNLQVLTKEANCKKSNRHVN